MESCNGWHWQGSEHPGPAPRYRVSPSRPVPGITQAFRSEESSRHFSPSGPLLVPRSRLPDPAIWLSLVVAILIVYSQTGHFEFVNYDDPEYVRDNVYVQGGLTLAAIRWAFTSVVAGNWMPLTLLSHVVDGQFLGMQSGGHHLVNVLIHAAGSILLFVCLRRATGAYWPSAFTAFVFAIHPLHVESVAWVAERKDVLFAFFWFLALYAYIRYTERKSVRGYLFVAAFFCCGLMSKPTMVTFPFALLLFDVWPLRRAQFPRVIWEKLPLIGLSAAMSVVTFLAQGTSGAVQEAIPFSFRIRGAAHSYLAYIGQMFWPSNLAVFYPYRKVEIWEAVVAAAIIAGISAAVVAVRRNCPYLLTGWLWYLGTLVPVIGLVQAGSQAMADRYTYIPAIGISLMVAWGAADIAARWPRLKPAFAVLAVLALGLSITAARKQTGYWLNSGTLFQHAVDVTKDNYVAESGLGIYLALNGHEAEAIPHLERVVRLIPSDSQMHNNLGILLSKIPGREAEAIAHFEASVRLHPDFAAAQYNLGTALSHIPGREADAIAHLEAFHRLQATPDVSELIDRLRLSVK